MKHFSNNHLLSNSLMSMIAALLLVLPAQQTIINAEVITNIADQTNASSSESNPEPQQNEDSEKETSSSSETESKPHWKTDENGKMYIHKDGSYTKNAFETIEKKQYYFNQSGYAAVSQWLCINDNWHYFNETGTMAENQWIGSYYVGNDGVMLKNTATPDGYYVGADGAKIPAGWKCNQIGWWYMENNGTWPANAWKDINGSRYYFNGDGYMVTNWQIINGSWYYFDDSGRMAANRWNGNYYLGSDGIMLKNTATPDGYYVGSDGAWIPAGWKYGRTWWYMESNGTWPEDQWKYIDGSWYYFDHTGYMVTGWQKIKGEWYFLRNSGEAVCDWQYINGCWYYFNSSCTMVHDQWTGDYYLGPSGAMATNQWIGNYYVRYNGACARNGWLKLGDYWYHFNGNADIDAVQQYAPTLISDQGYYISPMKTGSLNTPSERIEAMISRAYDYTGSIWKACYSQAPGGYADCSGLVMQCLLAAGFDPSPAIPSHHARRENEYDSRTLYYSVPMRHVSVSELQRGDLVWYARNGIIIHIAIYLGNGQVIDSWPPRVTTHPLNWPYYGSYIIGAARPFE